MAASPAPFLCGMAVDAVSVRKMATREQEIAPAAMMMLRAQLKEVIPVKRNSIDS